MIATPRSGQLFSNILNAWVSAFEEMVALGKQYYPDAAAKQGMIPELGVEIYEQKGGFSYNGIVPGWQVGTLRAGSIFFGFPGDPAIAARGHMHWINIQGNPTDWAVDDSFFKFRVQSGRPTYTSYTGAWTEWRRTYSNGRRN